MVGIVVVAQVVKSAVTIITVIVVMADIIPTDVIGLPLSSGFLEVEVYSYWFSPPMLKINLWDV
jgi:hypothetical protein